MSIILILSTLLYVTHPFGSVPPQYYNFNFTTDKEEALNTLKMLSNNENDLSYLGLASSLSAAPSKYNKSRTREPSSISFLDAIKLSPKHGDIMRVEDLKRQQNHRLKIIAKCMNNSYGIVMNKVKRKRRNRVEVRLEWIQNKDVKAGIKLKYLKLIPNIYIHRISDEYKDDWLYISHLCGSILQSNGRLLINQLMDISMMSHANIVCDSLIFPLILSYDFTHVLETNRTSQIVSFLSQIPYHLTPAMFQQVMDKLYSSKITKIKSIRTKLLPKLKALYADLYKMHFNAFNNISGADQSTYPFFLLKDQSESETMRFIHCAIKNVKTPQEFQTFLEMLKKTICRVLHIALRHIMTQRESMKAVDAFLKGEKHVVYVYDVVNTYAKSLMSASRKDLHIICSETVDWNYEHLVKEISGILPPHPCPIMIADAIIKIVSHDALDSDI